MNKTRQTNNNNKNNNTTNAKKTLRTIFGKEYCIFLNIIRVHFDFYFR